MNLVIGADEVGYGSIAGPLIVAAVAFDSSVRRIVLKRERRDDLPIGDSKSVPNKLHENFERLIKQRCIEYSLFAQSPGTIDALGVSRALKQATATCVHRLLERIVVLGHADPAKYRITIDGDMDLGEQRFEYRLLPKADTLVWQVGAASILAKAEQVRQMCALHAEDGRYDWASNNGYPSKKHRAALDEHGVTAHHRKSYKTVKERL
jgi:ribonuclease HII